MICSDHVRKFVVRTSAICFILVVLLSFFFFFVRCVAAMTCSIFQLIPMIQRRTPQNPFRHLHVISDWHPLDGRF